MYRLVITDHAKQRYGERFPSGADLPKIGLEALENGRNLTDGLKRTVTALGWHLRGYWTATYKILDDKLFVYQKEYKNKQKPTFILVSVWPLKWLKERRADYFRRRYLSKKRRYTNKKI